MFKELLESKTLYEKWIKVKKSKDEQKILKFFFNNSIVYQDYKIRKFKQGVKTVNPRTKEETYWELSIPNLDFILSYPIENGKILQNSGEIVLRDFEDSLKRSHDLIKM